MLETDAVEHELDEDADARTFQEILVRDAADAVFTRELAAECWARQLIVVIDAPNDLWAGRVVNRVTSTVNEVGHDRLPKDNPRPYVFRRTAARPRPGEDFGMAEVLNRVSAGRSIVGVFSPASQPLPVVTDHPDVHLEIRRPGREDLARALSAVTGELVDPATVPPIDAFDLERLAFAVRPRASMEETLQRLKALTKPAAYGEDVPDLREFAAYGAARDWALSALRIVDRIRSGDPSVGLADLPRGILLAGPPGVGKTLYARALAKTLGLNAVLTSASDWLSAGDSHLGAVVKAIRSSVEQARASAPSILFIDECDSIVDRDLERGDSVSWWLNFVNAILSSLDGAVRNPGVIIVGACNNADRVDRALRRSGRMEKVIEIGLPVGDERQAILRHYLRGSIDDAGVEILARRSEGRSGADLERAVRDAKAVAADAGRPLQTMDVLAMISPRTQTNKDLRSVAIHEAGHAVAAVILGIEVREVDVDGAVTRLSELEPIHTRKAVEDGLTILLAGRAADERLGGGARAGAGGSLQSDLALATQLASLAHARFGLGVGLTYRGTTSSAADLIESDREFGRRVEAELEAALRRSRRLIKRHEKAVAALARELEVRRFLTGLEIVEVVRSNAGRALWIF